MNIKQFDFLDFGASKGESIEFAKNHLFGKRGLGIDIDPKRVEKMKKAGYDCMVGDLADLDLPPKCVKFVKMSHILEHLPDVGVVERVIATGARCATDFLVITGPFFDEDEYLASLGLKLPWSDYTGHTCHLTVSQLVKILQKLKLSNYELYLRYPIPNSSHEQILPLAAPANSHTYHSQKHPRKKRITFDRHVWTDFVCYIRLNKEIKNWHEITCAYQNQIPSIEMNEKTQYIWPESAVQKFIALDEQNQMKNQIIRNMKAEQATLRTKTFAIEQQLSHIQNSQSWKAARLLQRAYSLKRHIRLKPKKQPTHSIKNQNTSHL